MKFSETFNYRKQLAEFNDNKVMNFMCSTILLTMLPFGCIVYSILLYYLRDPNKVSIIYYIIIPISFAIFVKIGIKSQPNFPKLLKNVKIPLEVIEFGVKNNTINSFETIKLLHSTIIPKTSLETLEKMFNSVNFVQVKGGKKDV